MNEIKHSISVRYDKSTVKNALVVRQIKKCINATLSAEGMFVPCEINVLLTDDEGIRAINKASRNIDKATDVLSFPMFEFQPGKLPMELPLMTDCDTGLLPLGDMALSLERAAAQAEEFGHTLQREVGYLTIHSMLHLLGYDHTDEGEMKKQMRAREEQILADIELPR
jgi:probable rRNA maturation factor